MTMYNLKPRFQNLLRPLVKFLADKGVTANQVTVSAMLLSCVTGGLVAGKPDNTKVFLMVPAVLFIRMALNAIDGMLAKEYNMKSSLGAVLNELGDVVSDSCLYLPLSFVPGIPGALIVSVVILSVISEMAGVVAVQIGATRRYDGPMGKSDRAFVIGMVYLLLGFGINAGLWLSLIFGCILFLLIVTIINRASKALKEVGS